MANMEIVKGEDAVALVLAQSTVTGLNLGEGQWCAAQVEGGASALLWDGPAMIPGPPTSTTAGSGTLTQTGAGSFTIRYAATSGGQPTDSETDSQVFLRQNGVLYGSQTFDLVDTASAPPSPPPPPAPLTLTAAAQLAGDTPQIVLTWSGG